MSAWAGVLYLLALSQDTPRELDALRWLARHQAKDGSWGRKAANCACEGVGSPAPAPEIPRDPEVEKSARPLLRDLAAEEPGTRDRAAKALKALGEKVLPFLEDARLKGDAEVRARAVELLAEFAWERQRPSVRATALALQAFSAAGYWDKSKDVWDGICFGDVVRKGTAWLLERQGADGYVGLAGPSRLTEGHALAALALAEIYGLTGAEALRAPTRKAVDFIAKAPAGEEPRLVELWALLALVHARYDGLKVDDGAVEARLKALRGRAGKGTREHAAYAWAVRLLGRAADPDDPFDPVPRVEVPAGDPWLENLLTYAWFLEDGFQGADWKDWWQKLRAKLVRAGRTPGCGHGSSDVPGDRLAHTALEALSLTAYFRYQGFTPRLGRK